MARRRSGAPTPEDLRLWRKVTETVTPLRESAVKASADPEDSPGPDTLAPAPSQPARSPARTRPAAPASGRRSSASSAVPPELLPGRLASDGATSRRLKRGRLPIDARIDLHGMTQHQAHGALRSFLDRGARQGWRCVLVITGKGTRADGGMGVLRAQLPHWLNGPGIREKVLGFTPAQPQHGGSGAVYVLLRRDRTPGEGRR